MKPILLLLLVLLKNTHQTRTKRNVDVQVVHFSKNENVTLTCFPEDYPNKSWEELHWNVGGINLIESEVDHFDSYRKGPEVGQIVLLSLDSPKNVTCKEYVANQYVDHAKYELVFRVEPKITIWVNGGAVKGKQVTVDAGQNKFECSVEDGKPPVSSITLSFNNMTNTSQSPETNPILEVIVNVTRNNGALECHVETSDLTYDEIVSVIIMDDTDDQDGTIQDESRGTESEPETVNKPPGDADPSLPDYIIITIVIGIVAAVVLSVGIAVFCYKRSKREL